MSRSATPPTTHSRSVSRPSLPMTTRSAFSRSDSRRIASGIDSCGLAPTTCRSAGTPERFSARAAAASELSRAAVLGGDGDDGQGNARAPGKVHGKPKSRIASARAIGRDQYFSLAG
jgi:hypothetical protein